MTPKKLVTIIAITMVVCSATVIGIFIATAGLAKIIPQSIRFALTCLLAYSLIRGWNPGRWIVIVLLGLGSLGSFIGGIALLTVVPAGFLLLILGIIYAGCAIVLLTPLAKAHFLPPPQAQPGSCPASPGNKIPTTEDSHLPN